MWFHFCFLIFAYCQVVVFGEVFEDYTIIEVDDETCLYVSNNPIWPFATADGDNQAEAECAKLGVTLAGDMEESELTALLEVTRCKMNTISSDALVLVQSSSASNKCSYQKKDGTIETSDDQHCIEDWDNPDEDDHVPVHYACRKTSKCEKIPNCVDIPNNPSACYMKLADEEELTADACESVQGYLPRFLATGDAQTLKNLFPDDDIWTGMMTPLNEPTRECDSFADCMIADDWTWLGGGSVPPLPIDPAHQSGVGRIHINGPHKCIKLKLNDLKLDDKECDEKHTLICTIPYGGSGLGASIAVPQFQSGTITCPDPPDPPGTSFMKLASDQPLLMCPGKKALYECDAGGVNVRKDVKTTNTYDIKCKEDQTYQIPNDWPVCTDKFDCPAPILDSTAMSYDWTSGLTPPFDVTYDCIIEKKMLVLKAHLDQGIYDSVSDTKTIACQLNGTYDKNIQDYQCSRVCPYPINPDPEIFEISVNETSDPKPEIYETVQYWCKDPTKKLVSKAAFATGVPTNELDELVSMCQVTGWLNETIGSFACTKDCEAPQNYTEVFDYDYVVNSSTVIDTEVIYKCWDSRKKVVNLIERSPTLTDDLTLTCLYNGQWDKEITEYGCTECLRRNNPANGRVVCESKRYAEGSKCEIKCDPGYIPLDQIITTCILDEKLNDFVWDVDDNRLICVRAISLLIGGIGTDYQYLDDVEVFAPGMSCLTHPPAYPHKIVGTVGGFTRGTNIVCGGGVMEYVDCSKHPEGMRDCETDIHCAKTNGEALWCTGPKTKACYMLTYDPVAVIEKWQYVLDLKTERAYASGIVLANGEFWITGGASKSRILDSTEILYVAANDKWKLKSGPKLTRALVGHCMAPLNGNEFIIAGGYSPDEDDYSKIAEIYNLVTKSWTSKVWMKLPNGPRFDSSCLNILIGDESRVVMAGGWNNTGMVISEYFENINQVWVEMGTNDTGVVKDALQSSIRSSTMVDLDGITYLAGGVTCSGHYLEKPVCHRISTVHRLDIPNIDVPWDARWIPSDLELSKPKSSHSMLKVPLSYCNRIVDIDSNETP